MREKLQSRGRVEVFFLANCDLDEFEKVEREYTKWLLNHPNALAVLYYAGHAVEFRNHNWLLLRSSAKQRNVTKDSVCMSKFIAR